VAVTHGGAKAGQALLEDLAAVRHKEQARLPPLGAYPRVVQRGDHRLARAGGGDDEVAGMAGAALLGQRGKDFLLVGIGP
jgi:hypothetical protein